MGKEERCSLVSGGGGGGGGRLAEARYTTEQDTKEMRRGKQNEGLCQSEFTTHTGRVGEGPSLETATRYILFLEGTVLLATTLWDQGVVAWKPTWRLKIRRESQCGLNRTT